MVSSLGLNKGVAAHGTLEETSEATTWVPIEIPHAVYL